MDDMSAAIDITAAAVGRRIESIRGELGLSQRELAALAECTQGAISGIEGGRSLPSLPLVDRIARALDVSIDHIVRGDR